MGLNRTLVWRPGCASCAAAREFLTVNGVPFESVNPTEPAGEARWSELGRPRIPSLVVDGHTTAIYHVSQVAALVGLAPAASAQALRLAWDLAAVLEAWEDQLAAADWDLMTAPTRSRGRTVRNLTVNVHEPVHEMTSAWESGVFHWNTDDDEHKAAALRDADEVRAYAHRRTAGWIDFLMDVGDGLVEAGREVRAGVERLSFLALLDSQRFHAAFHYRQLCSFLAEHDAVSPTTFDLAQLPALELPRAVF